MKRYIKSSVNKIDPEKLLRSISTYIRQFIPKNCKVRLTPRHDAIELYENCPQSEERIRSAIKKVLEGLGYECKELNREWRKTIAAVKDNTWIELGYTYDDFNEGLITIASDNSNDIEEDVMGTTQLNKIPDGYLKTSKFTTPSIKTDGQRNALEAFEIAVSEKFKQFEDFMTRQVYLTSESSWRGKIEKYSDGYYINLEGTRSGFQAFVSGDSVVRKPRRTSGLLGWYEVDGNSGTVYWMSEWRSTRLPAYKRQLKEVREEIEQFEDNPERLRHPEYSERLEDLKRKEADLVKWISEDENIDPLD